MLSGGLLNQLEEHWRRQRAPLLEHLRPGLTDSEADSLTAPLGLHLPVEARIWWGWHDGVSADVLPGYGRTIGGPGFQFLPLKEAVAVYVRWRKLAGELAGDFVGDPRVQLADQDYWWPPSWFPITSASNGDTVACDCSVAEGDPTPIRVIVAEEMGADREPAVDSFGQMIDWWIEALDLGAWRYDPDAARWNYDYKRLDPARELTRLV